MSNSLNKTTINGVDIVQEGDVTHFFVHDNKVQHDEPITEHQSWFKRLCRWFVNHSIHPYVKVRDLADPVANRPYYDTDKGCDGHSAIEAGIRIGF